MSVGDSQHFAGQLTSRVIGRTFALIPILVHANSYLVQVVNGLVITNREAMAAVFNGSVVSSAGNFLNSSQTTAAKLVSNSAKTSVTRAVQVLIKHDYETYGLTAPSPFPTLNSSTKFYPGDNYTETEVVGMEKLGYIEPMYAELEYFVLANGAVDLVWTIDNQDEAGYWWVGYSF